MKPLKPMLNRPRPPRRRLLLILFGLLLAGAWAWQHYRTRRTIDLTDWDVARLVDHLHRHNLPLNSAATAGTAEVPESAYLSTVPINRAALSRLERSKNKVGDWKGVVYCQVLRDPAARARERQRLGDSCRERGPFLFFGDPDLLDRIDDALSAGD